MHINIYIILFNYSSPFSIITFITLLPFNPHPHPQLLQLDLTKFFYLPLHLQCNLIFFFSIFYCYSYYMVFSTFFFEFYCILYIFSLDLNYLIDKYQLHFKYFVLFLFNFFHFFACISNSCVLLFF